MKKALILAAAVMAMALAVAGCSQKASGSVSTDGSTSMEKVIGAQGEAFEAQNTGVTYVRQDTVRARMVIAHDDIIDSYFIHVRKVLIQKVAECPAAREHALDLLMIDKYLERIGDHAVNIAEWVIFSVTGAKEG